MPELTEEDLIIITNLVEIGLRGARREWRESIQYTSLKDKMTEDIKTIEILLEKLKTRNDVK